MSLFGYNDFHYFETGEINKTSVSGQLILRDYLIGPFLDKVDDTVKTKILHKICKGTDYVSNNGYKLLNIIMGRLFGGSGIEISLQNYMDSFKFGDNVWEVCELESMIKTMDLISRLFYKCIPIADSEIVTTVIENMELSVKVDFINWILKKRNYSSICIPHFHTSFRSTRHLLSDLYKWNEGRSSNPLISKIVPILEDDRKPKTDHDFDAYINGPKRSYNGPIKPLYITDGDLSITNDKRILHNFEPMTPHFDIYTTDRGEMKVAGSASLLIRFGKEILKIPCWYVELPVETVITDKSFLKRDTIVSYDSKVPYLKYRGARVNLVKSKDDQVFMKPKYLVLPK